MLYATTYPTIHIIHICIYFNLSANVYKLNLVSHFFLWPDDSWTLIQIVGQYYSIVIGSGKQAIYYYLDVED